MMKIAFGSCSKLQDTNPQPVWDEIRAEKPDALLLLGDNIYLDHNNHTVAADLSAELKGLYAAQSAEPSFAALRADMKARGKPVIAIYDDHDFLGNDRCGGESQQLLRVAARAELIAAFNPPRTGADVYSSQVLGPVRLIVLDTRYYRETVAASASDRSAILGAAQWTWLEAELGRNDTTFAVIGSSTTFHHHAGTEAWEFYPAAFARLRDLLRGRVGALVLSGDIHHNALYDDSGVIEVVSSAVARRGVVFGGKRKNYGVLEFDAAGVKIDLRALKAGDRFRTQVMLGDWKLS